MDKIKVGRKFIGDGRVFIIAEAGINHEGRLEDATKMVRLAAEAGADAIKFQSFRADKLVVKNGDRSVHNFFKDLELSREDHIKLVRAAENEGIIFLSTPFDTSGVDLLEELGVPAYKIASGDVDNYPLLRYIASKDKPMIISTGASTLDEVSLAVDVARGSKSSSTTASARETATSNGEAVDTPLVLLHCTSNYPTEIEDVNLYAMKTLRIFGAHVGYSDHTLGTTVSVAAAALGATVIEKHFTLDKNAPGPDHRVSADPAELASMVTQIRKVEKALGSPIKKPVSRESEVYHGARRSLVAGSDIPAGTTITGDMVDTKRPQKGLKPVDLPIILGRKARVDIAHDEFITLDKIG